MDCCIAITVCELPDGRWWPVRVIERLLACAAIEGFELVFITPTYHIESTRTENNRVVYTLKNLGLQKTPHIYITVYIYI